MLTIETSTINVVIQWVGSVVILWALQQAAARLDRARKEKRGRESTADAAHRKFLMWQEAAYDQRRAAIDAGVPAASLPPLPEDAPKKGAT